MCLKRWNSENCQIDTEKKVKETKPINLTTFVQLAILMSETEPNIVKNAIDARSYLITIADGSIIALERQITETSLDLSSQFGVFHWWWSFSPSLKSVYKPQNNTIK